MFRGYIVSDVLEIIGGTMKLSIIIPAYNAEPYLTELLARLVPQLYDDTEVIVVDDGSIKPVNHKEVTVIRQKNGGVSVARNTGLNYAKGDYIAFIDADDMVTPDYIEKVYEKIEEGFDYCYISWEAFGHWKEKVIINSVDDKFPTWNLCVWNRIYKRELIGDIRFNPKKLIAEDAEFIRDIEKGKKAFISKIIYQYRSDTPQSLTKRFNAGVLNTKRIVYYFPVVTKDMTYLINEFKEADKDAEVILLTTRNEIPELSHHAMIMTPRGIKGTELRGQKCTWFTKIDLPINADIILYMTGGQAIGGIETFIYNFCISMHEQYNICVLYNRYEDKQLTRLRKIVRAEELRPSTQATCKTLIINRITDSIPHNIEYQQCLQMVHTCQMDKYRLPVGRDKTIFVSDVAQKSFGVEDGVVINNLVTVEKKERPLVLLSATRLTYEKGESRMVQLAKMLNARGIPFIWMILTSSSFRDIQPGMILMKPTLDISGYIEIADYVVQLSDVESFCYTLVESLMLGTPVITTPLEVLDEIGVKDGSNGYILPFNVAECEDIDKIYHHRLKGFKYAYNNKKHISQWRELLDAEVPKKEGVRVEVIRAFRDVLLNRHMDVGYRYVVTEARAAELIHKRMVKRI